MPRTRVHHPLPFKYRYPLFDRRHMVTVYGGW